MIHVTAHYYTLYIAHNVYTVICQTHGSLIIAMGTSGSPPKNVNMDNEAVEIISMNVKGLQTKIKRQKIFHWIEQHNCQIICVQESHSSKNTENMWKSEFDGDIIFSHGRTNALGVMIMFKNKLSKEIHEQTIDPNGRYVIIDVTR